MPWIDAYETHDWETIELSVFIPRPVLSDLNDTHVVCGAESPMAASAYKSSQTSRFAPRPFFFCDFEQIAADHEPHGIAAVGQLSQDWMYYPAGTLVMVSYEGVDRTVSPVVTIYIERVT